MMVSNTLDINKQSSTAVDGGGGLSTGPIIYLAFFNRIKQGYPRAA
jgi:hypothetical protein